MVFEQRDNSGALFKNTRKEKANHPDYQGNAMIDGREYYISAWLKEGRNGKFFSFAFKPKEDQAPKQQVRRQDPISTGRSLREDLNDDIPFGPEVR